MLHRIKQAIPGRLKKRLKRFLPQYRRVHCPVCGAWDAEFLPFGVVRRLNARCAECGSLERHRLLWLFFHQNTDLFDGRPKKMLHIAPEPMLAQRFSKLTNLQYVTVDLLDPSAMVRVDITRMSFPIEMFDVLYCSHVLEHVPDDRKAMRECLSVLKPRGWAVFLVPITVETTVEDPSVTDPAERERLFGQSDHVRRYGRDFATRLEEAGFNVVAYGPRDVEGAQARRYGIPERVDPIFFCQKRVS